MQMNILCITYHIHRRCFPVYPTPFWIPDRLYHLKKCKYFQKAIPSKDIHITRLLKNGIIYLLMLLLLKVNISKLKIIIVRSKHGIHTG